MTCALMTKIPTTKSQISILTSHPFPGIAVKLRPLVKALKDAERITHEATRALDAGAWSPDRLERDREPTDGTLDALDQLVACARSLTEDVRRAASFINGNASLLFRWVL